MGSGYSNRPGGKPVDVDAMMIYYCKKNQAKLMTNNTTKGNNENLVLMKNIEKREVL